MKIYQIDPTRDPRWENFVRQHPSSSVFHSVPWLQALQSTYGYVPVVFTTSPPTGDLKNGVVFCRVNSWLTGRRLISLPFSDHCEPLCDTAEELTFIVQYLQTALQHQKWKYLELRPIDQKLSPSGDSCHLGHATGYLLHVLDLRPSIEDLFRRLDKDSVQRRIRRAERAGLVEKVGRSDNLLHDFYALFVATRSRHGLPPIPLAWFRNLIQHQRDGLQIRVAYKDAIPISSILTLQFKDVACYKYGCSDSRFNKFGGTPWLLWRAIAAAKADGATNFDLGRSEEQNAGLVAFKNHWVGQPKRLVYWTFPPNRSLGSESGWKLRVAKRFFSRMPNRLLTIAGRLIYRHIA